MACWAWATFPLPFVETGIGLSVVTLGLVVALLIRPPIPAAMALVALLALFHGHAHEAEMPEDVSGLAYAAGFIFATALLHAVGVAIGIAIAAIRRDEQTWLPRLVGAFIALAGLAVLGGAF